MTVDHEFYILAGGGTGGHLYPGLAVAEALQHLRPNAKIVFACSSRLIDRKILDPKPYAIVPQAIQPLPRRIGAVIPFLWSWIRSGRQSKSMVRDLRPRAVLGLGGFAAAPIVRQAALRGIPSAMLNPDAVPGKANRYLAQRVEVIFTQFESTREQFAPALQPKVRAVGCPIRREIAQGDRREALKYFGLQPNRKTLLVFGGSLSSASINEALSEVGEELARLSSTWQVLHVAGKHDIEASPADRVLAYCDRMDLAYAVADLAVCRGGASTIAELTATSTPAVIFPYPHHSDRQQTLNAAGLVQCGAAVCVEEAGSRQGNAELLRKNMIPLMQDSQRLDIMRQASGRQAKVSAADDIARWLSGSE